MFPKLGSAISRLPTAKRSLIGSSRGARSARIRRDARAREPDRVRIAHQWPVHRSPQPAGFRKAPAVIAGAPGYLALVPTMLPAECNYFANAGYAFIKR